MCVCKYCEHEWDLAVKPLCPVCNSNRLQDILTIFDEHHPGHQPHVDEEFRSYLTWETVEDPQRTLDWLAHSGTWFWNDIEQQYNLIADKPYGQTPGSGAHPGSAYATIGMDILILAKATTDDAHAYVETPERIKDNFGNGHYIYLPKCETKGCPNIAVPYEKKCLACLGECNKEDM